MLQVTVATPSLYGFKGMQKLKKNSKKSFEFFDVFQKSHHIWSYKGLQWGELEILIRGIDSPYSREPRTPKNSGNLHQSFTIPGSPGIPPGEVSLRSRGNPP